MGGPLHTMPHKARHYDELDRFAEEAREESRRSMQMLGWSMILTFALLVTAAVLYFT
jgi:hypothetical protein